MYQLLVQDCNQYLSFNESTTTVIRDWYYGNLLDVYITKGVNCCTSKVLLPNRYPIQFELTDCNDTETNEDILLFSLTGIQASYIKSLTYQSGVNTSNFNADITDPSFEITISDPIFAFTLKLIDIYDNVYYLYLNAENNITQCTLIDPEVIITYPNLPGLYYVETQGLYSFNITSDFYNDSTTVTCDPEYDCNNITETISPDVEVNLVIDFQKSVQEFTFEISLTDTHVDPNSVNIIFTGPNASEINEISRNIVSNIMTIIFRRSGNAFYFSEGLFDIYVSTNNNHNYGLYTLNTIQVNVVDNELFIVNIEANEQIIHPYSIITGNDCIFGINNCSTLEDGIYSFGLNNDVACTFVNCKLACKVLTMFADCPIEKSNLLRTYFALVNLSLITNNPISNCSGTCQELCLLYNEILYHLNKACNSLLSNSYADCSKPVKQDCGCS